MHLVGVSDASHATHHAEDVVVDGVDANLGRGSAGNGARGKNKLKSSIVNAGEVAAARGLVLLRAKSKGVDVDAAVGSTGVVLVGLDNIEVGALTLREAVLTVELELGSHDGVLAPAVHVKGGLGKNERASIGEGRARDVGRVEAGVSTRAPLVVGGIAVVTSGINRAGTLEETRGCDEGTRTRGLGGATKGVDGVGESIDGIGVVEGLGTKRLVKGHATLEGGAVIHVGIGLDNPDKLLAGVVEVELDLVGGGADGLVTRELELLNEVLVGVLGHLSALISVKEDVVNVEGGGNKGLLVGHGHGLGARGAGKALHGPEALTNGAEINVDLDLVVLERDERERKAGVAAEPEEKGDVEGGLGEGVAGGAHLLRATSSGTRARDVGEVGIRDVGKLGGVTDHLEVTTLLLGRHRELVPHVHPITILAVDALATNLNLNLSNELLTDEV